MLFMGIDVGTQGVRCIVVDESGKIEAAKSVPFKTLNIAETEGRYEQAPEDWEKAAKEAILACTSAIADPDEIVSISIDGTSGTVLPLDRNGRPLRNGIMYNDPRAGGQAKRMHECMGALEGKMGYRIGASYSLPRLLWMKEEEPEIYENAAVIAHQADYIAGLLCGEFAVSDYSNALKTGYDLIDHRWPEEMLSKFGLDICKQPKIIGPGMPIGRVRAAAAEKYGLSTKTMVVGGSTDGYASALAAGAVGEGRWASIIGTTFVLKGVTKQLIIDPNGSSYSHMLPNGQWLLGGAANLGGRILNNIVGPEGYDAMNAKSCMMIPTGVRCYPLTGKGERFPFVMPDCEAFYIGDIGGGKLYPAVMEGIAYAERMALDHMADLGCGIGSVLYATGGACRSDLWLKIRASVQNRCIRVPEVVDAAMGSALLAASETFGSLENAADHMVHYSKTAEPDGTLVEKYNEIYDMFRRDVRLIYGVKG